MMIRDNGGQVALEYMLIFAVGLILLIVFTLPLLDSTISNTLDVSDTMNVKSDLSEISHAVMEVYGQGQGSRQSVDIDSSRDFKVNVGANYLSANIKLKDGSSKSEKVYFKSNLEKSSFYIEKGDNSIIVEWPEGCENMRIRGE